MIKLDILGKKDNDSFPCYNCESNLEDYLVSLPEKYKDYDVQRGIVKNAYLDNLTETVLSNNFIPPIVLISENAIINDNDITFHEYKILDGLQRTVRLQNIYNAFNFYQKLISKETKEEVEKYNRIKLAAKLKHDYKEGNVEIGYLMSIIKYFTISTNILNKNIFKNFKQWFIIWDNLDKTEQINKMLILNAGHKSMDLKHQLELLFMNILPSSYLNKKYTIKGESASIQRFIRAKDINSAYFYKNKKEGQIHLSHLISALIAFERMVPFTLKQDDLQKIQDSNELEFENLKIFFENENMNEIITFIEKLDLLFKINYPNNNEGIEWLGRESILIGLFSSFGKFYKKELVSDPTLTLESILEKIYLLLEKNIAKYKISEFNEAKKSIDITKLNIGNVFKFTTYYATCKILNNQIENIDWVMFFKDYSKKVDDGCK